MRKPSVHRLRVSQGISRAGESFYGPELRKILYPEPKKPRRLSIPLAMLIGLGVAAFTHGAIQLVAALIVVALGIALPIVRSR